MILVDLNVILDVVQNREPHVRYSAKLLDLVLDGRLRGALPSHFLTTMHYILGRAVGHQEANRVVHWLLDVFEIIPISKAELTLAADSKMPDFEDAVTAAAAEKFGCDCILTRDMAGFAGSRLKAVSPEMYLAQLLTTE